MNGGGGGVIGVLSEGAKRPSGGRVSHGRDFFLSKIRVSNRILEHLKIIFQGIKLNQNSRRRTIIKSYSLNMYIHCIIRARPWPQHV